MERWNTLLCLRGLKNQQEGPPSRAVLAPSGCSCNPNTYVLYFSSISLKTSSSRLTFESGVSDCG